MPTALDRNTGLPMNMAGLAATIPQTTTQTQTTAPRTDIGSTSTEERTATASTQATSSINTTPGALAALEQLINQLSERPNLSASDAASRFPLAQRVFDPRSGWQYINPRGGMPMSQQQGEAFNARQVELARQAQAASGTTPGGTAAQRQTQGDRQQEIATNRTTRAGYTRETAGADANALIQKSIADALEAAMPQISAQLEGAGTSRSTIAANLTQKAALRGGVEGAALGANLGVQYGNINTQLSGVLEMLTRSDPNSPEAMLLQAIIGSRGLVSTGVTAGNQQQAGARTGSTQTDVGGTRTDTNATRTPTLPGTPANSGPQQPNFVPGLMQQQLSGPSTYAFSTTDTEPAALDATYQQIFEAPDANSLYEIAQEDQ